MTSNDDDRLPPPSERAAWMARAQDGDGDAYRRLLEGVASDLRGFFRRRVREVQEVEDLVQETLLTVHRARHTYDPARPFEPWLYAIARNTLADAFRRDRRRAERHAADDDVQAIAAEPPSHASGVDGIFDGLPEGQREALEMVKIKGLSIEQAAVQAGISQGAMRVRIHRGYRALRARLLGGDEE
jgi:RNA polymerase sigma-70 factor, ECF subfamily